MTKRFVQLLKSCECGWEWGLVPKFGELVHCEHCGKFQGAIRFHEHIVRTSSVLIPPYETNFKAMEMQVSN